MRLPTLCAASVHMSPPRPALPILPPFIRFSLAEVVGFYESVDVEGVIKKAEQNKQLIWEMQWNTSVKSISPS